MTRLSMDKGYTFVELIVVSGIIIVLASAVMPLARVAATRQRESELRRALRDLRTAIDKYKDAADLQQIGQLEIKAGSEGYPADLDTLVEGVAANNDATGRKLKFLRRVPVDPMTHKAEWGKRAYQDDSKATRWGGQNVFDVYTTFEGTALDGTKYETGSEIVAIGRSGCRLGEIGRALKRRAGRDAVIHERRPWARGGFTLIELMVVMSLIVILATMGLVQYRQSIVRSKEAVLKEDLFRMRDALDQYFADKSQYPATLDALVTDGYLRRLPKDPFTEAESWQTVQAEPDPANLTTEPGISDIKSASEALALDGSKYSDW